MKKVSSYVIVISLGAFLLIWVVHYLRENPNFSAVLTLKKGEQQFFKEEEDFPTDLAILIEESSAQITPSVEDTQEHSAIEVIPIVFTSNSSR